MAKRFIRYAGGNLRGDLVAAPDYVHVRPGELYPVGSEPGDVFQFANAYRLVSAGRMQWADPTGEKTEPRWSDAELAALVAMGVVQSNVAAPDSAVPQIPVIPVIDDRLTSSNERAEGLSNNMTAPPPLTPEVAAAQETIQEQALGDLQTNAAKQAKLAAKAQARAAGTTGDADGQTGSSSDGADTDTANAS